MFLIKKFLGSTAAPLGSFAMPFEEASTSLELLHPQQSAATNQQTKNIEQKEEDKEKP